MQGVTGQEWIVAALAAALALVALVLLVALVRGRSRTARELSAARVEAASLRAQVEEIERRLAASAAAPEQPRDDPAAPQYLITHLGEPEQATAPAARDIDGALFVDLVLRETVVRAAALTHGLRRALGAETRHRIRFEVRSQTRAARKQRRRDLRDLARQSRSRDAAADAA